MAGSKDRALNVVVTANIEQLRTQLKNAELSVDTASAAMKRMSSAYDPAKSIANANAAMIAISKVGGVTGLTEAEQRKLNATLNEGIAKYAALGKSAPADMLKLRDATAAAVKPTNDLGDANTSLMGKLKGVAGMMGIAFGGAAVVAGLKSLITNTFQYAETIKDTSAKMGVSMEATQRWKFAAEQTGASLENVSKSVLKLSQGIDGGDKGLKQALESVGVQFDSLKGMKPEDAFNVVAGAIAKIPDPMTQARLALEAFGKSGTELLPALREGFTGLADGVKVMSDDTINRLDDAKDAWQAFGRAVTIYSGEVIGGIMSVSRAFLGSWKEAALIMRVAGEQGMAAAIAVALGIDKAKNSTKELTAEQKAMDAAFDATFRKQNPALAAISTSTKKVATEVKVLGITWSGSFSDMLTYAQRVQLELDALGQALVNMPPPPPFPIGPIDVTKIGQQIAGLAPPPEAIGYGARIGAAISAGIKASLSELGNIIGGALLNLQAGQAVNAMALGQSLGGAIGKGIGAALGGPAGAQIGSILGGLVGGWISTLINGAIDQAMLQMSTGRSGAAGSVIDRFFGRTRQPPTVVLPTIPVVNMATQREIPGFPTRAQMQQAARDAEEVYKYIRDSGLYTAGQVDQAFQAWQDSLIAAGNAGAAALKKIDAEMKTLQDSIAMEAPEEVMGVIEAEQRARLAALEIEKAAALKKIEEERAATELAAGEAAGSAQKAFDKTLKDAKLLDGEMERIFSQGYTIPFRFSFPTGFPGGSGGGSGGGGTTQSFSRSAFTQMQRSSSGSGGNTGDQTIEIQLDGEVITRRVIKGFKPYLRLRGRA